MLSTGADLSELPSIGKDLAGKIAGIVETGHFDLLDSLKKKLPGELGEIAAIPGLGPKRVKLLYDKLKVRTLDDLPASSRRDDWARSAALGRSSRKRYRPRSKSRGPRSASSSRSPRPRPRRWLAFSATGGAWSWPAATAAAATRSATSTSW
jgi:hypothetical protein